MADKRLIKFGIALLYNSPRIQILYIEQVQFLKSDIKLALALFLVILDPSYWVSISGLALPPSEHS